MSHSYAIMALQLPRHDIIKKTCHNTDLKNIFLKLWLVKKTGILQVRRVLHICVTCMVRHIYRQMSFPLQAFMGDFADITFTDIKI